MNVLLLLLFFSNIIWEGAPELKKKVASFRYDLWPILAISLPTCLPITQLLGPCDYHAKKISQRTRSVTVWTMNNSIQNNTVTEPSVCSQVNVYDSRELADRWALLLSDLSRVSRLSERNAAASLDLHTAAAAAEEHTHQILTAKLQWGIHY